MLALQTRESEFEPQNLGKKLNMMVHGIDIPQRKQMQEDVRSLLTSQPSLFSEFQASERFSSRNKMDEALLRARHKHTCKN